MAVKERREKYILPMLKSLNMSEDIVFYDIPREKKDRNAMQNARRTWTAPTEADFVCVLQDDLELCDNFKEIVYKCAENFPTSIFSFYQPRLKWEDKSPETPYIKITGCGMYGPAILIPSKLIPLIFWWGDENFGADYPHDDTVIGIFASMHDISVMATIPCILQHLGHNDSMLGYNNKSKVSKVYAKEIDVSQFDTNKYVKSKSITNFVTPPKNGFKHGTIKKLSELKGGM